MRSAISIAVAAPPEVVFGLARDVGRWPALLPHYRSVTIEARRGSHVVARMVAVRSFGPITVPVIWRAEQWPDGSDPRDLRLRFRHVRGVTRGMEVTWHIRALGGGSLVTIDHDFVRPVPLLGGDFLPAVVDRLFTRHIAAHTLRTFKALAEVDSADGTVRA